MEKEKLKKIHDAFDIQFFIKRRFSWSFNMLRYISMYRRVITEVQKTLDHIETKVARNIRLAYSGRHMVSIVYVMSLQYNHIGITSWNRKVDIAMFKVLKSTEIGKWIHFKAQHC